MVLLFQDGEGLAKIKTSLPQQSQRQSRFPAHLIGSIAIFVIDMLKSEIIGIQPVVREFIPERGYGLRQSFYGTAFQPVPVCQGKVVLVILYQILVKTGTLHLGQGASFQKQIDLSEHGKQKQACHIRVLEKKAFQGVHVADRIGKQGSLGKGCIAQKMHLRA